MNILLFAIDHIFQISHGGEVYTTGGKFPYSAWTPYLEHCDSLVVFSRGKRLNGGDARTLSVSSGPCVRFQLVDAQRGFSRFTSIHTHNALLKREVAAADAVIGRLPSEFGLSAVGMARQFRKPYMVELVACPWDALWNHGGMTARLYAPILAGRTRQAMKQARLSRYVTAAFLQQRYPTKGEATIASNVMLVGASDDCRNQRAQRYADLRSRTAVRPLTIGTIGALHTRLKGVHTAITALARAQGQLPDFQYRILGEGDSSALAALVEAIGLSDRVFFDGVLPAGDAVAYWLDTIDIYLQPSFQEGLPRGLIEALSRGCLAAGSTAGGIPELLPLNRLHRPGDAVALADKIATLWRLIQDGEPADEVARNLAKAAEYDRAIIMAKRHAAVAALKSRVAQIPAPAAAHYV